MVRLRKAVPPLNLGIPGPGSESLSANQPKLSVKGTTFRPEPAIIRSMLKTLKRSGLVLLAWTPFFIVWTFLAFSYAKNLTGALLTSAISMGTAAALGIVVWYVCVRIPWPLRPSLRFYLSHIGVAVAYSIVWLFLVFSLESIRSGQNMFARYWRSPQTGFELFMGILIYGLFAGVSYATQIRDRLHEKELLAQKAEALANAARLDAIRARLNPHFLFNALHTLSALVKFRPAVAEQAIERLGDMLRYALKEDGRDLVEFSEEFEFTRQYLAFEKLRYEDRLCIELRIEPQCDEFEVPPFSIQTLAENAVHHAISVRPEGGSIRISATCSNGQMRLTVADDGPGDTHEIGKSHQLGLRSLRERLVSSFGPDVVFETCASNAGFEAKFEVPIPAEGRLKQRASQV